MPLSPSSAIRSAPSTLPRSARRATWVDLLIVLAFALFAATYHLGRWAGVDPFVYLGGDAGNIASMAAARDHPELFVRDALFADPRNVQHYSSVHVPLVRLLARIFGNYGTAYVHLLGPHVFIMAVGFYVFGRVLLGSRLWALLVTAAVLMPLRMNLGERWGIMDDPLPRFSFQALLPFILAAAYHWRSRPRAWPWILAAVGLLVYVHPVSAPPWGLALWLALWLYVPATWSTPKRLGHMFLIGLVFLLVAAPFVVNYLGSHAHGATLDYDQVFEIMRICFSRGQLNVPQAIREFASIAVRFGLAPLAGVGVVVVWWLRRADRRSVAYVALWLAGVLFVATVIPWIEHAVARKLRMIPLEIDLARNMRYSLMLMLVLCAWSLAELARRAHRGTRRAAVIVVGVALTGTWIGFHPPDHVAGTVRAWTRGEWFPPQDNRDRNFQEAVMTIARHTPPHARILPLGRFDPLAIRYYALRPIAFCYKDRGLLAYADHAQLLHWFEIFKEYDPILVGTARTDRLGALIDLARRVEAEYVLLSYRGKPPPMGIRQDIEVMLMNPNFVLFRVKPIAPEE